MKLKSPFSYLLSSLVLIICSAVLTLVIAEYVITPLALRITGKPPRELMLLGFVSTPNTLIDDTPINAQGYTGDVISKDKSQPSTIRILTLGGSAMFNRKMTQRLIEGLSKITPRQIEVMGAALRTHTTRSSLIKYEAQLYKYHFDYVLIYHGINDLWMNHVAATDFRDDYSHLNAFYKRNSLINNSLIARYLYNKFLWRAPPRQAEGAGIAASKTFEHNMRQLIQLVKRDGGVPVLMTFAWHIPENYTKESFESDGAGYNNQTRYDMWPVELWGEVDYVKQGLILNNSTVRKLAREENVLLIDQESMLSKDIRNFGDVCHFSESGTEIFVNSIAYYFKKNDLFHSNDYASDLADDK